MDFHELLAINHRARDEAARYEKKRRLFDTITVDQGKHFIGIVGPRGVGKTVLLKQLSCEIPGSFYLSVDTLEKMSLDEACQGLIDRYKVETFLIDEIHFEKNYARILKVLFDQRRVRLIFTSSVALSLRDAAYDLSRRVRLLTLFPFSLLEYIRFRKGTGIPPLVLEDILKGNAGPEHLRFEFLFEDYLRGGLYPFALDEGDPHPLFRNIIDRIIRKDIPMVAPHLRMDELPAIEKAVEFIARSPVDDINYSTLSRNLDITKYKAQEYIALLRGSFLVNVVLPSGTNVLKEPKILMHLPYRLLFRGIEDAVGALREDFFAEAMLMNGMPFTYLKGMRGEKTPDFLVTLKDGRKLAIEIGGRGKGREQFKGIRVDEKVVLVHGGATRESQRPLFLLGFLETGE